MADVKPINCGRGSLNRGQTSHFFFFFAFMSNRRSSEQLPLLRTHANVVGDGLSYHCNEQAWTQLSWALWQISLAPTDWRISLSQKHKGQRNNKHGGLGSKRHFAGGGDGGSNPIVCSSSGLLLYIAHVIYSSQVIFNPYYVTRWNQTYGKFRDISGYLAS